MLREQTVADFDEIELGEPLPREKLAAMMASNPPGSGGQPQPPPDPPPKEDEEPVGP